MDERQRRLAGKFVAVEEELAELYAVFAAHFTRRIDLWEELEREERNHARMALEFLAAAERGTLAFRDPRAQEALLDNLIRDIGDIRRSVRDGALAGEAALRLALDIETSLVEREAFRHYVGSDPETRRILDALNAHTMRHGERIRLALA